MPTLTFEIDRMSCGACVRRVTQTLNTMPGVRAEEVRVGMARVRTEENAADVASALEQAGYPARLSATTP